MINFRRTASRHPGAKWALGAVEFIVVDALLIFGIVPAWAAAVSIPLADRTITIDLGDLPAWVVAGVAAGGFWKAWRAEKRVIAVDTKLAEVGVKIDGLLVARDAAKVREGEDKATAAAEVSANQRQQGVEQGIAQERASVAAANPSAAPAGIVAGEVPVPVADDKAAEIAERSAKALERSASAAEETPAKKP